MPAITSKFKTRSCLSLTIGSEIEKTRPCLVISPDEMNQHIRTVIVAPMTTAGKDYPTRVACTFKGKRGQVVLDQIRTVDKARLTKKLGTLDPHTQLAVISVLQRLFAILTSFAPRRAVTPKQPV